MKSIHTAIVCLLGALSLQSCLHDDKEFFSESAANRIESTVENATTLLESADNGWELHYYTGEDMSGGGFTFLMKFKGGKVTVAGDCALATSSERATSSYEINKNMGPVLAFNTYNSIFHVLGEPSYSNIEGEQGDWEFVITELTQDSIFVRGKKWGNSMVLTRVPATVDWTAHLDSIAAVEKQLTTNYSVAGSDDANKMVEVNTNTRRIYSRSANNSVTEQPFYITTTGIHAVEPVKVGDDSDNDLEVNADGTLKLKNFATTLAPYYPTIDTWIGNWTLTSLTGGCDITISRIEGEETTLMGEFTLNGYTYSIGLIYNPEDGTLNMPQQLIEDPTGQYPAIWFINADLDAGTLLGEGGMNLVWHGVSQEADFEDDGTLASQGYTTDSFVGMASTTSGSPITSNGSYIFTFSWYYLSNLTPNK